MSNLKDQKTIPKPFCSLPELELSVEVDEVGHITCFNATCNCRAISIQVKNSNVLEAWQKIENFISKQKVK